MPQRTRTRANNVQGFMHRYGTFDGDVPSNVLEQSHVITDYGSERDMPLTITKRYLNKGTGLNGPGLTNTPDSGREYHNWFPSLMHAGTSVVNSAYNETGPSSNEGMTKLLAMTNPSTPHVDMPLFMFELRELPSLIRKEGKTILESVAEMNLQTQFGWAPLISDLGKMFNFQDAANKRFVELKHLRDGGISRKRTLYEDSLASSSIQTVHTTNQTALTVFVDAMSTLKYWGSCRWKPGIDVRTNDRELLDMAHKLALGHKIGWNTVWNALPWSWMADWFSNVGEYLAATRNTALCTPDNMLIMRHRVKSNHVRPRSGPWPDMNQSWEFVHEIKTRHRASAQLKAGLPILTMRQFSILGSLAILRKPKGKRTYLR